MSDKKTLVFLPGFMGQENDFSGVIERLPPWLHGIVLPLPSCEKKLEADTFETIVEHWWAHTTNSDKRVRLPKKFYLYGYSLGGRVALALAKMFSLSSVFELQGLFLESAHVGLTSNKAREARSLSDAQWAAKFSNKPLALVLKQWYSQTVFADLTEEQVNVLISEKKTLQGARLAKQLTGMSLAKQPHYGDTIAALNCPVAYFSGERDTKFTAIGQDLSRLNNPKVNHHTVAGSGHNIHFQQPSIIANHIVSCLQVI